MGIGDWIRLGAGVTGLETGGEGTKCEPRNMSEIQLGDLPGAGVPSQRRGRGNPTLVNGHDIPLGQLLNVLHKLSSSFHVCVFYYCRTCSRGGRRRVEDMCYERRRAKACVDESAHHALVNAGVREGDCVKSGVGA